MSARLSRSARRLLTVTAANAGAAVYGTLMIGVLLAADDARHLGYPATVEAAVVVLALYWLTSLYAHTLAVRLRRREPINGALVRRGCLRELPVIEGAAVPLLALLAAWAAGLAVTSGGTAALWAAVVVIVVLEIVAGWRSRGLAGMWFEVIAGAMMGLALIALKFLLH